jgi:hypothetical protein
LISQITQKKIELEHLLEGEPAGVSEEHRAKINEQLNKISQHFAKDIGELWTRDAGDPKWTKQTTDLKDILKSLQDVRQGIYQCIFILTF